MEEPIKLAIVGSRSWNNYEKFKELVDAWQRDHGVPVLIISGGPSGVDSMARRYAKTNKIPLEEHYANWKKYGRKAGPMRNTKIISSCTHVLAFPGPRSVGTWDSINKAKELGKILKVSKEEEIK